MQILQIFLSMQIQEGKKLKDEHERLLDHVLAGKPAVVVAGAGAGKTTTLGRTIASLISGGDKGEYYAITFTNEASHRLRTKLFEETGEVDVLVNGNISTIHSFCVSILREHLKEAELKPGFRIVEDTALLRSRAFYQTIESLAEDKDVKFLIENESLMDRNGLFNSLSLFADEMIKNGIELSEVEEQFQRGFQWITEWIEKESVNQDLIECARRKQAAFGKCCKLYLMKLDELKREENLVTYDDIIYRTYLLLRKNKKICDRYRSRIDKILVDEFQDTDKLQHTIIDMISNENNRVYAGDIRQSIYGWRYADTGIFIDVRKKYQCIDELNIFNFDRNYRSSDALVNFYNHFFPHLFRNSSMQYTPMRSDSRNSGENDTGMNDVESCPLRLIPIDFTLKMEERRRAESQAICSEIRRLVENGFKYGDIALLFRSRTNMQIYEDALREQGIPYVAGSGNLVFETDEVKDIISLICHLAFREKYYTVAALRSSLFAVEDDSLLRLCTQPAFDLQLLAPEHQGIRLFLEIERLVDSWKGGSISQLVEEIMNRTDIFSIYLASKGKQAYANLRLFLSYVRELEREGVHSLNELAEILNDPYESEGISEASLYDGKTNAVLLMTIHASKGLEFPIVFIPDIFRREMQRDERAVYTDGKALYLNLFDNEELNKKLKRDVREMRRKEREEEERRVLYVAMTRAKKLLYFAIPASGEIEGREDNGIFMSSIISYLKDVDYREGMECIDAGNYRISFVRTEIGPKREEEKNNTEIKELLVKSEPSGLSISATYLASLLICPYRHVLGEVEGEKIGAEKLQGITRGEKIHRELAVADFTVSTVLPSSLAEYEQELRTAQAEGLLKREIPFSMKVGSVRITGKMDALIVREDNGTIIDYKTGKLMDRAQEYKKQLQLYALALSRLYAPNNIRLIVLGLDKPEETIVFNFTPTDAQKIEGEITEVASQLLSKKVKAKPSLEACSVCAFNSKCTYSIAR